MEAMAVRCLKHIKEDMLDEACARSSRKVTKQQVKRRGEERKGGGGRQTETRNRWDLSLICETLILDHLKLLSRITPLVST